MLINCDMGESFGIWELGQDQTIMPFIDMANIACGMHASDPSVMLETVRCAKAHNVKIGAHPGYNDLQGFGRRFIEMPLPELQALFIYQLGALQGICQSEGVQLSYVKPHGALYNAMMKSDAIFMALMEALAKYDNSLPFMAMAVPDYQRYQEIAAQHNISLLFEAFVDRTYQQDGRLTPRSQSGACHSDLQSICDQAMQLVEQQSVLSIDNVEVPIKADTLCIHGDGTLAVDVAKALYQRLKNVSESAENVS
ncbi:LamB/YcsF family protein [Psychromonas sp. B3M02]|uniref:5-oxoprolinase subunit PxpA n=1 Tax=Psychromonas sp. B3M02 TaxID=2267226 RepID=UPI000DE85551|nr:5-oxoprolinase subunit PxpA [Psychromonas sp. B3M02]RBW46987.1 LamB/YcsF family protein [Psychromonas sp. B3M02]